MSNGKWQLADRRVLWKSDNGSFVFDQAKASEGLQVSFGSMRFPVFGFLLNDPAHDQFIRGDDLVFRYPPRNSDLVSYETYYRIDGGGTGVELIVSAQTELLDSKPEIKAVSSFGAAEIVFKPEGSPGLHLESHSSQFANARVEYVVVRPNAVSDRSVLLMVHPSDFHRARIESDKVAFWVFPHALEKGVIRRARFYAHLLTREDDEKKAAELFRKIESRSPPLAT